MFLWTLYVDLCSVMNFKCIISVLLVLQQLWAAEYSGSFILEQVFVRQESCFCLWPLTNLIDILRMGTLIRSVCRIEYWTMGDASSEQLSYSMNHPAQTFYSKLHTAFVIWHGVWRARSWCVGEVEGDVCPWRCTSKSKQTQRYWYRFRLMELEWTWFWVRSLTCEATIRGVHLVLLYENLLLEILSRFIHLCQWKNVPVKQSLWRAHRKEPPKPSQATSAVTRVSYRW